MKCLGRGVWGGLAFRDIETVRGDDGSPFCFMEMRNAYLKKKAEDCFT